MNIKRGFSRIGILTSCLLSIAVVIIAFLDTQDEYRAYEDAKKTYETQNNLKESALDSIRDTFKQHESENLKKLADAIVTPAEYQYEEAKTNLTEKLKYYSMLLLATLILPYLLVGMLGWTVAGFKS